MTDQIRPEFELVWDFMPVLVTSKFDEDPIKNERARHHFLIISLWEIFQTLKGTELCRDWTDLAEIHPRPRFSACPLYLQVWKRSDKKQQRNGGDIVFPIISQLGLSVATKTSVLIQSVPKPYATFPTLMMLHIKFDQDWPTGLKEIFKFHLNYDGMTVTEWRKDKANSV